MKIVYEDKVLQVHENVTVIEALNVEIKKAKVEVIACKINHEVKPLNYVLQEEDRVELLNVSDRDGARIYTRGLLFIMAMAFHEVYPEALLTVNYQLNSSMLCEIYKTIPTAEMIQRVREKMQEIIDKDLPIKKVEMSKEKALEFMEKENTIIGKMQIENMEKEDVSFYFCEEYFNYFYGVMPISTGYVKCFDIMKYHDGFLIRYPSKKQPNVIEGYQEGKKLLATLEEYEDIYRVLGICTLDKLNKLVREGKAKELILLSEALHEKKISQIADKIAADRRRKVILIAGPSSSGKTTFAKRLGIQLRLNGLKPKTISVDNYFVEREETPKDELGNYNFEAIEAVDLSLLNHDLTALLNGEEIAMPTFDFKEGHKIYKGNKMSLAADEVLVMEGIHCLNDRLTKAIPKEQKFKIYISALTVLNIDYYNRISTTDTRIIRRTVRDSQFRGYPAEKTLAAWYSVTEGEEKNIFPYQEEADVMFNSSLIYEFNALKEYALPLFEKIGKDNQEYAEAKRLAEFLKYFEPISIEDVPKNSLLQEFLGNSLFEY
ncbi:MAG: nucleoside kinase [Clostridia bacterium]